MQLLNKGCDHSPWSHQREMEERDRETKLLFGDRDWECRDTWSPECRIVECRNAEMNARSHGANPMVQVNLSIIGGLILSPHSVTARNH
jgi:hypothetical protein